MQKLATFPAGWLRKNSRKRAAQADHTRYLTIKNTSSWKLVLRTRNQECQLKRGVAWVNPWGGEIRPRGQVGWGVPKSFGILVEVWGVPGGLRKGTDGHVAYGRTGGSATQSFMYC